MEDPVAVCGRMLDEVPYVPNHGMYVIIPESTYYIYNYRTNCTFLHSLSVYGAVLSAMTVERSHLVAMVDRCIKKLYREISTDDSNNLIGPLWTWKTQLVLERIRRNMAARTIQRQFRESMSNPAYGLCKQRLLREFADLNDSNREPM